MLCHCENLKTVDHDMLKIFVSFDKEIKFEFYWKIYTKKKIYKKHLVKIYILRQNVHMSCLACSCEQLF